MTATIRPALDAAAITKEITDLTDALHGAFEQMDWAEDEIRRAVRSHPGDWDTLYHSFILLKPTHELMTTEFVYRGHCRELLRRVVNGEDTRPGTAAEVCCALSEVSLVAPMTLAGTGLYMRAWRRAFPEKRDVFDASQHYEAIEKSAIDAAEGETRAKLAQSDRRLQLDSDPCGGRHHGETVACRYARSNGQA